jgi:chorismate synthase
MQIQRCGAQGKAVRQGSAISSSSRCSLRVRAQAVAVSANAKVVVKEHGSVTLRGTVRKVNEDRYDVKVGLNAQQQQQMECARCEAWADGSSLAECK